MFATKVEVTPTDVGLSIWLLPRRSAQWAAIRAVHWYGRSFTFVDDDHRVLVNLASLGFARELRPGGSAWTCPRRSACVFTITRPSAGWALMSRKGSSCSAATLLGHRNLTGISAGRRGSG